MAMVSCSACSRSVFSEVVVACGACMFIVGSVCFLSAVDVVWLGDLLFILGGAIYLGKSTITMVEQCKHVGVDLLLDGHETAEFFENLCYFVSCTIFSLGCVLWWPHIYGGNEELQKAGLGLGAYCFILGSFGFVVATFFNAVILEEHQKRLKLHGRHGSVMHKLSCAAMAFSQLGAVLFVAGSYMYRPGFDDHCDKTAGWSKIVGRRDRDELASELAVDLGATKTQVLEVLPQTTNLCVAIAEYGTQLYIVGSLFYLAQAALCVLKAVMQQKYDAKHGASTKEHAAGGSHSHK